MRNAEAEPKGVWISGRTSASRRRLMRSRSVTPSPSPTDAGRADQLAHLGVALARELLGERGARLRSAEREEALDGRVPERGVVAREEPPQRGECARGAVLPNENGGVLDDVAIRMVEQRDELARRVGRA